jgi:hypothetical protein
MATWFTMMFLDFRTWPERSGREWIPRMRTASRRRVITTETAPSRREEKPLPEEARIRLETAARAAVRRTSEELLLQRLAALSVKEKADDADREAEGEGRDAREGGGLAQGGGPGPEDCRGGEENDGHKQDSGRGDVEPEGGGEGLDGPGAVEPGKGVGGQEAEAVDDKGGDHE